MKLYQIDTFTDQLFKGNPAAVCPLDKWISDDILQKIAAENNLSETAFYVKKGDIYEIRWFTPKTEVWLCGHATLATAYVLFNHENHQGDEIRFQSLKNGLLTVRKENDWIALDFPADPIHPVEKTAAFDNCFNIAPKEIWKGTADYVFIYENEEEIKCLKPNLDKITELDAEGVIVTAPSKIVDFVSRYFGPRIGINEDPVTGSAHTLLTPYWHTKTKQQKFKALQLSERGGFLKCRYFGERIEILGKALLYAKGNIDIEI